MMPYNVVAEPPEQPTIYAYPWEGVPVGNYHLHTQGSHGPATLQVVVERSQHGELYVRYINSSALISPRSPHTITSLRATDILRPRGNDV